MDWTLFQRYMTIRCHTAVHYHNLQAINSLSQTHGKF